MFENVINDAFNDMFTKLDNLKGTKSEIAN